MNTTWHFDPNDDDEHVTDNPDDDPETGPAFDTELDFTYSRRSTILQPLDQIIDDDDEGPYGGY